MEVFADAGLPAISVILDRAGVVFYVPSLHMLNFEINTTQILILQLALDEIYQSAV